MTSSTKTTKTTKQIEEKILGISIELAKKGEGSLIIIANDNVKYELLIRQTISFNINDPGALKLLRSIATIDGAVILNKKGDLIAYSAMIKNTQVFNGFGTRTAAAITASKGKNIAILSSEEEHKVKIFRDGKFVMQMDALQRNIEKEIPKVASFLESIGAGLLGAVGVSVIAPTLGITFLPGIIIFGASYYALKNIINFLNFIKKK